MSKTDTRSLRKCRICEKEALNKEDLNLFRVSCKMHFGRDNLCKECDNKKYHIKKELDKEGVLYKKKNERYLHKYGLTKKQRDALVEEIGYCQICGKKLTLKNQGAHTDHSHRNKEKNCRGVLCNKCNTGLGKFNDNIDLLNKAIRYLIEREHKLNPEIFSIEFIIDLIYHNYDEYWDKVNGTNNWKATIKAIKDKYPKV